MRCRLIILLITITSCSIASAEEQHAQSDQDKLSLAQPDTAVTSLKEAGPVAVPEPSEKAMSYYRSGNVLWVVNTIWGFLIPALFLFTGFSARIRNWAIGLGRKWLFIIAVYLIIFSIISYIIDFPLDYYQSFVRQHSYDLSNQTFAKWFGDSLKSLIVGIVATLIILPWIYWLLKKSPKRWWLYSGLGAIPFIFFFMMVYPIWVAPLFNDFGPMKDKALEAKILGLADRAGIEGSHIFEVNKSIDTKKVNAYVTGFFDTKRIVLWDTLIEKFDEHEILFVMSHEMGHYVLKHVVQGIFFASIMIIISLYLAHRTAGYFINRFRGRFGFDKIYDIASLPLLIILINVFSLVLTPIGNFYSRYHEHQADRFGLEITRNNHAAATAFVKLQTENLGNPRPGWLYKLWRSSHPPLAERIEFCNTYKPWETGEPLEYEHLFNK